MRYDILVDPQLDALPFGPHVWGDYFLPASETATFVPSSLSEVTPGDLVRIVEFRFFAGLSVEETAAVLGLSPRTFKREWRLEGMAVSRTSKGSLARRRAVNGMSDARKCVANIHRTT